MTMNSFGPKLNTRTPNALIVMKRAMTAFWISGRDSVVK